MWTTTMLTDDMVHKLVGMGDNELGLSIVRTILEHDSGNWSRAVSNLQEAKAYGSNVKILASPWTPPLSMKTENTNVGGHLRADAYDDYAAHLNDYISYMSGQGVTIDVVSIQNEPDIEVSYDSCDWTADELRNFARDYADSITGAQVMASESFRYNPAYTDPILNDSTARGNVDIIGGHLYGCEASGYFHEYALAESHNKPVWMTEYLMHEADGGGAAIWGDPSNQAVWDETLDGMLRGVHMSLEYNWSAYIWWWARRFYSFLGDGDSQFGTTLGEVLKRGWAFSQYAKFVRPGYQRIGVSTESAYSSLYITAYEGDGKIVFVMLNRSTESFSNVVFEIPNGVTSAEAYVTSRTAAREAVSITSAGKYATLESIPERSVLTVVMSY
ncbi:MAG: glycoside hydrolase family 5 [Deltaproteobacteria bacterium]|nr:glycoside hydrolase family 5 [Deltaproteobacteria bacterium]MBN2673208.1 glycoside hydrolase family 5 [Deltaproteobacteria bacterium]